MEIKPIAYFRSPLGEKFGTPRQAGLVPDLPGTVEFCDGFKPEMLDGLEGFDYLWLIWGFSLNNPYAAASSKVRPPRLGGNEKMGVYATRSPYRPNPIGLSSVKIESIDAAAGKIFVLGADLVEGTPIFDVKPYLEYADAHTGIRSGYTDSVPRQILDIQFSAGLENCLSPEDRKVISGILSQDPRPAYHNDPERIYGLNYAGRNIKFRVEGQVLTVLEAH